MNRITLTTGQALVDSMEHHEGVEGIKSYFTLDEDHGNYYFVQLESGNFYVTLWNQVFESKFLEEVVAYMKEPFSLTKDSKKVLQDFVEDWNEACSDTDDIEYAQEQVLKAYKAWWPEVFCNEIQAYLVEYRKQYEF